MVEQPNQTKLDNKFARSAFYSHSNWVELGSGAPLRDLGLAKASLPATAAQNSSTCQQGVLDTEELTSGYLNIQEMPAGKCHHGNKDMPGINKDTNSCWSPQKKLHAKAAEMAIEALESHLNYVRFIVNDENYERLFELTYGSALVIAIDGSGSMGAEIAAVKIKVKEIVQTIQKSGRTPSRYVFIHFANTHDTKMTVTFDAEEYLAAVEPALANLSGTELFWSAVQLGLTNSPPHSDIIVFTDEPGDDPQLKETVIGKDLISTI